MARNIHFEVVENAPTSLLSGRASETLNLINFNKKLLLHTVTKNESLTKDSMLRDYKVSFKMSSASYKGHVFHAQGLWPDVENVRAVYDPQMCKVHKGYLE